MLHFHFIKMCLFSYNPLSRWYEHTSERQRLSMEVAALLFVMNVHIKIAHLFHFSFQYYSVLPF